MRRLLPFLTVAALLAATGSAVAAQRYAAPGGAGTVCSSQAPCQLKEAVTKAKTGDEVIIGAGTYEISEALYPEPSQTNIYLHGELSGPMPQIVTSGVSIIGLASIGANSRTEYLNFTTSVPGGYGVYCGANGVVERVIATAMGEAGWGIAMVGPCVVRNSVARSTGLNGIAMGNSGIAEQISTIGNVTAIATGPGSKGLLTSCVLCFTGGVRSDVENSILTGVAADLETSPFKAQTVISHSNFRNAVEGTPGSIVDSGGNQSAAPLFVDAAAGDYRETPGSPTIDAGAPSPGVGTLDLAGNPRVVDGKVDIGAYEHVPPSPPPGELTALSLKPKRFRAANIGGAVASARKKRKRAPIGTKVSYALTGKSTLTFTVQRKIVKKRKGKRKKVVFKTLSGSFNLDGAGGPGSFKFSGRIGNKALKPGSYKLIGSAGGAMRSAPFTIVK